MKIILLGGGAGTRLWPLSNDVRSKQYVQLLKGDNGQAQSLIQRIWGQLCDIGVASETIIATNEAQQHLLKRQLNEDAPIILEPARKDTFPSIALAATKLLEQNAITTSDTLLILPADTHASTHFYLQALQLHTYIEQTDLQIGLLGVTPTFAASQYGYMLTDVQHSGDLLHVQKFIEKPNEQQANELINAGALWNSGVIAIKVSYLIETLKRYDMPTTYAELYESYESLPKISIDYAAVQQCKKIGAIHYTGAWEDLGSWRALVPYLHHRKDSQAYIQNSARSIVVNELHYPIALVDMPDCIVVASPDGVLITNQHTDTSIKPFVMNRTARPMYEERAWGTYRVLERESLAPSRECLVKRLTIEQGKNISYQRHTHRNEVWTILAGQGLFAHEDEIKPIQQGDVVQILAGERHAIYASSQLEILEVQYGSELVEEDIERLLMSWAEIEQHIHKVQMI